MCKLKPPKNSTPLRAFMGSYAYRRETSCAGMTCHFNSPVVDLHSKSLDMSLPSRSNFLHVHAVLSKNLAEQKYF